MPLTDAEEPTGLVISMPMDGFSEASLDNLRKLVDSKATLIKKALAVEALPIKVNDDRVSFHWFSEMPESEDTQALMALITALCEMAKNQNLIVLLLRWFCLRYNYRTKENIFIYQKEIFW